MNLGPHFCKGNGVLFFGLVILERDMETKVTLSIDFGYKNIGIALVRNQEGTNIPLSAGTLLYDPFQLSTKVGPRAELRRGRRTRKTKRHRLNRLKRALLSLNLSGDIIF